MNFDFLFRCLWHNWKYDKPNTAYASDGWWTSTCKRRCKKCGKEQTGHATSSSPKWDWVFGDWIKQREEEENNKRRSFEF